MYKKRVTDMKISPQTYQEIMKCKNGAIGSDAKYRSMLVSLKPNCYVEAVDGRGGDIIDIERDEYDIPVRIGVSTNPSDLATAYRDGEHLEWIDVHDINFWEAWDFIAPIYLFEDDNAALGELMFESEVK